MRKPPKLREVFSFIILNLFNYYTSLVFPPHICLFYSSQLLCKSRARSLQKDRTTLPALVSALSHCHPGGGIRRLLSMVYREE